MPLSGDILFTIRIYLDPLAAFIRDEDGSTLRLAMAAQLEALSPDQVAYKGLADKRDGLIAYLRGETTPIPAKPASGC
ncbi:hypothetical protein D3C87_1888300 [compost metagenome]